MKTRTKIIIPTIVLLTIGLFYLYIIANGYLPDYSDERENNTYNAFQEKRELFMDSHGLHNLDPTERDGFITKYTNIVYNGEFHSQVYITDLQNEYSMGEPITFTVATWGYGHPCQSPSFVYYYETKDPENIVFEDKFIRWCQALEESDYTNYYQELGSNRTDKAQNKNIYPVFYKSGEYIVSVDDRAEYSFSIIESKSQDDTKNCSDGQAYNEVLFKCVISCEVDLVYNGYTDSCTTEFELKYHGYCNDGFTYDDSSHVCHSDVDPDSQQVPLKDPPRTLPPEPELISKDDVKSTQEHYEIEIIGLEDEYVLGEEYSFYFIISGYGHECTGINVSYPDENGKLQGSGQEHICDPNLVMHDFEINSTDRQELFGNIAIKNPGTYIITVTFDRPSQYFPTTVSQEFRVVEE